MTGILFITSSQAINEHYLSPSLYCCCYNVVVVVLIWIKNETQTSIYCLVKKKDNTFQNQYHLKKKVLIAPYFSFSRFFCHKFEK